MKKPAIPGQFTSLRLFMDKLLAVTMQLKMGSATVPVGAVGSRRAGTAPNGIGSGPRNVFGQRPKTAGATPALPKATASFRLSACLKNGARLCRRPAAAGETFKTAGKVQGGLRLVEDDTAALRHFSNRLLVKIEPSTMPVLLRARFFDGFELGEGLLVAAGGAAMQFSDHSLLGALGGHDLLGAHPRFFLGGLQ